MSRNARMTRQATTHRSGKRSSAAKAQTLSRKAARQMKYATR